MILFGGTNGPPPPTLDLRWEGEFGTCTVVSRENQQGGGVCINDFSLRLAEIKTSAGRFPRYIQ